MIQYKPGDKFDAHKDFCPIMGDAVIPLTGIICLRASDAGGGLLFSGPPIGDVKVVYEVGDLCMFPSWQTHESEEVREGEKIVLKFDAVCSADALWWAVGEKGETFCVSPELLQCIDYLAAYKRFRCAEAPGRMQERFPQPVRTPDLQEQEAALLLDFFSLRHIKADDVTSLRHALRYAGCPEADFDDGQLQDYSRGLVIMDPSDDKINYELLATRHCNRMTSFACSYTYRTVQAEKERVGRSETPRLWVAADVQGGLIGSIRKELKGIGEHWGPGATLRDVISQLRLFVLDFELSAMEWEANLGDRIAWREVGEDEDALPELRARLKSYAGCNAFMDGLGKLTNRERA